MSNVIIRQPITGSTGAYAQYDSVGGLINVDASALAAPSDSVLNNVLVLCKSAAAPITLYFFRDEPATSTITDNAAINVTAADFANIVGVAQVEATDYYTIDSQYVASVSNLGIPLGFKDEDVYIVINCDGAFTLTAATDMSLVLGCF